MLVYIFSGSAQTNCACCHTEIEATDQTFYLTQSQYTDAGLTSPSVDPTKPGAWQGSHWSANVSVTGMTTRTNPQERKRESIPGSAAFEVDTLTTGQRSEVVIR